MPGAQVGDADAYDAWYATGLGRAVLDIERATLDELARPEPGERALDAGCGTGAFTTWLAGLGLETVGLDRDPSMLAVARRKLPQTRFVEGDVTRLPFADGEFDLALAVTVLCFLGDRARAAAARELVRVTRPGGRVVVGELSRWSLWAVERRVTAWLGSPTWRAARFTTSGELRRLFREAGARTVTTRHALYLPPTDRPALTSRAEAFERAGSRLGALGAAFVAVRADVPAPLGRVRGRPPCHRFRGFPPADQRFRGCSLLPLGR